MDSLNLFKTKVVFSIKQKGILLFFRTSKGSSILKFEILKFDNFVRCIIFFISIAYLFLFLNNWSHGGAELFIANPVLALRILGIDYS